MKHPLDAMIEAKIQAAQAEGAFDDLEGAGQPLDPCDDPENILLSRVVQSHGGAPEFVILSREMAALRAQLREADDQVDRQRILKDMSMMEVKIDLARKTFGK